MPLVFTKQHKEDVLSTLAIISRESASGLGRRPPITVVSGPLAGCDNVQCHFSDLQFP